MKFCEVACIDVIFKKRNKGVVNLLVSAGARRTTNDSVEGVVFFAQDVTTRQEKELMKKIKLAEQAANEVLCLTLFRLDGGLTRRAGKNGAAAVPVP